MKKTIIGTSLILSMFFGLSCSKDKSCKTCNNSKEEKEVVIDDNTLSGVNYRKNDASMPSITYMNNNVKNNLKVILDEYSLNVSTDNIHGMALFYTEEVKNYGELKKSTPTAILLYIQSSNDIITNCYFKKLDNSYAINPNLTGITSLIAGTDLINIDNGAKLNSEEIVLLFDSKKIPKSYYKSDFQVKTLIFAKPTPGGPVEPDPDTFCSVVPECKEWDEPGSCFFTESQNSPEKPNCLPSQVCPAAKTVNELGKTGQIIKTDVITNLYELRDNYLGKSLKGSKYIDNYYYTTNFFTFSNLNTDFLLNTLNFYKSNIPYKLAQMNNPLYQDSILINLEEKTMVLTILDKAKQFTPDVRFQNIIYTVSLDIDKYTNKKISEIKNDFQ